MSATAPINLIDTDNIIFQKAVSFVEHTNENIFLTGKAGSGKTTFLKYIKEHTGKQCAITAPTGVAAINAGGETLHSFLQLPFGPFIPGSAGGFGRQGGNAEDKHSLVAKLRFNETKRKVLRNLELLIIDEVSMVRCDMLDAVDLVLRHARKNPAPFGGVQMIFIGDLFQLPPVAPEADWEILSNYYNSPYFFDAQVLRQRPPLYIELKKIYRQKDQTFVNLLNRVRNGLVTQQDIDTLNQQCHPSFSPDEGDGYIILSTHNYTVDSINKTSLDQLEGKVYRFEGKIERDFNPKNLPTDLVLELKIGAQVMFVKNDLQTPRRFYNGKIGVVATIDEKGIHIDFPSDKDAERIILTLETWKNVKYTLNSKKNEIEEEEVGSFTQYPIRLAWAVTVHKSQGLTLDRAIVDLNRSFAPGQVYVALSRCTTLGGLVLRSKLQIENVIVDTRVIAFAQAENSEEQLEQQLKQSAIVALGEGLCKTFTFAEVTEAIFTVTADVQRRKTGPREKSLELLEQLSSLFKQAQTHAEKFHRQVGTLVANAEETRLIERKEAATKYFYTEYIEPCTNLLHAHIEMLTPLPKIRQQLKVWTELKAILAQKAAKIKPEIEVLTTTV